MSDNSDRFDHIVGELRQLLTEAEAKIATKSAVLSEAATVLAPFELAELIVGARRFRGQHISSKLFGEPAWDILLNLYLAYYRQEAVSITAAATFGETSATTGYRWLNQLEQAGLVERRSDETDQRRHFIGLTQSAVTKLDAYIARYTEWAATKAILRKL